MKKNFVKMMFVCGLVLSFLSFATAQNHKESEKNGETPLLEVGQIVEHEFAGGQTHSYKLKLSAGEFVKISVEERNCDVILVLQNSAKVNIFEYKNDSFRNGTDVQTAAVEVAGDYELKLMSFEKPEQKGNYTLKYAEKRAATEQEIYLTSGMQMINGLNANRKAGTATTAELNQIIEGYYKAIEKFELAGNPKYEAISYSSIGSSYGRLGNWKKAAEVQEKALEIYRANNLTEDLTFVLNNLSVSYIQIGDSQKALDLLTESAKISTESKNYSALIYTWASIGRIYENLGDYNRAEIYYEKQLQLTSEVPDKVLLGQALNDLGKIHFASGEMEISKEYFQKGLEIAKQSNNKRQEAGFLSSLGQVLFTLGDTAKSLEMFNESLNIALQMTDRYSEAGVRKQIGRIQLRLGETDKAVENLTKANEIYTSLEERQNMAEILLWLAKADFIKGNLETAQMKTEQAINIIEKLRKQVKSSELRDSFSTNLQSYYSFYIEILMERHKLAPDKNFAALAFQANENGKARGLLNLLTESKIDIRQGVDEKLLEKERDLRNLLSARMENLTKVLSGKPTAEQVSKLKDEIEQFRIEYEQIQSQIRNASPRYASLTQPQTVSLTQIQREILDNETVLLEYALGETKSYLWVVSKNNFQAIELPRREQIESTAKQIYDALTARSKTVKFETAEEQTARYGFADKDLEVYTENLSKMILSPAASAISNKKLLIVSDGALQFVPFASLKNPANSSRYLIETNQIVNLPSVSVLSVLRKDSAEKTNPRKTLAIIADPIFDKNDARFLAIKAKPKFETVSLRSLTREGFELSRLPFTRREADSISALVAPNQQTKRLDFQANRQFVTSTEISDYRYLHFATHGFIDAQMPEMSGIVLSLFDEKGAEQNGYFRIGDIYNLKLNAEMVVLSGCRTGLGKEIRGEGLVGIARGFMYAGARRVTVSLWDVNDEATSELMTKFYREMLGTKRTAPAESLRQAQISLIRSKKWSNPYYWASFILQGEPN